MVFSQRLAIGLFALLQAQAAVQGLSYADIAAKAEELNQTDPATLIKPLVVVSAGESLLHFELASLSLSLGNTGTI